MKNLRNLIKALMFTAILLMTFSVFAQTKDSIDVSIFTVGYNFTVNTTDREGNAVVDSLHTILMVGANVTKTMGYYTHKYKISNEKSRSNYEEYQFENMTHLPTIFVSSCDKNMEVYEDVPARHYSYTEPAELTWTLLEDTITISTYLCHKAQATYGGRTWNAYYTEEIPSTAGPWKLNGLPGLIVKAEDADGIFCFEMFELSQQNCAITKTVDALTIKTKRNNLINMRNNLFLDWRYVNNPLYYYTKTEGDRAGYAVYGSLAENRNSDGTFSGSKLTHQINGIAVPKKDKLHHYQPLELQ